MIDLLENLVTEQSYLGTETETYLSQNLAFALIEDLYNAESGGPMPIGSIVAFPKEPDGGEWLLCDGTTYLELNYPELWLFLSDTDFVIGPASFRVPDLSGRFVLGVDAGIYDIDDNGGEDEHILTVGEMPTHRHQVTYQPVNSSAGTSRRTIAGSTNLNTSFEGNDEPHNNMPPYLVLGWWMKAR